MPYKDENKNNDPDTVLSTALPIGTLKCPNCKQKLWFNQIHGIRLIKNGLLDAHCPNCNTYHYVKAKL